MDTLAGFKVTEHARQRMKERGIKDKTVKNILKSKSGVKPSFHGRRLIYSTGNIKVVINLLDSSITTVYWIGKEAYKNYTGGQPI